MEAASSLGEAAEVLGGGPVGAVLAPRSPPQPAADKPAIISARQV
jgi:hypothetical protein